MAKDLGEELENFDDEIENLKNAKFTLFGISLTPTTIMALLTAISALLGSLYGVFEVYADYMDMKEQIQSYVAPDMSGIEQTLAVQDETMKGLVIKVEDITVKFNEFKADTQKDLDTVSDLARDVDKTSATTQRELRQAVYGMESTLNERMRSMDKDLRDLRTELEDKMQKILDNPLNN